MKIGVISDTHGCVDAWKAAYERYFKDADMILHAGDLLYHGPRNPMLADYNPAKLAECINACAMPFITARGNCDSEVDTLVIDAPIEAPYAHVFADGLRIVVTHGHTVEGDAREELARRIKADLYITGHTHVPELYRAGGTVFLNPGSPSLSKREDKAPTIAVIEDGKISILHLLTGETVAFLDCAKENRS